jgi:hypothetical protein
MAVVLIVKILTSSFWWHAVGAEVGSSSEPKLTVESVLFFCSMASVYESTKVARIHQPQRLPSSSLGSSAASVSSSVDNAFVDQISFSSLTIWHFLLL